MQLPVDRSSLSQIARIAAATVLCPSGHFSLNEEGELEKNDETPDCGAGTLRELTSWVHLYAAEYPFLYLSRKLRVSKVPAFETARAVRLARPRSARRRRRCVGVDGRREGRRPCPAYLRRPRCGAVHGKTMDSNFQQLFALLSSPSLQTGLFSALCEPAVL